MAAEPFEEGLKSFLAQEVLQPFVKNPRLITPSLKISSNHYAWVGKFSTD